jgi:hypothetical protein
VARTVPCSSQEDPEQGHTKHSNPARAPGQRQCDIAVIQ